VTRWDDDPDDRRVDSESNERRGAPRARDLDPISPEEAVAWYLRRRRNELANSSLRTHRSSLGHFTRWTEQVGIENLNDLDGRAIQRYLTWRVEDAPTSVDQLAPKSEKTQIDITRKFIEYCESIDAVHQRLHEKILPFRIKEADEVRDEMLPMERIEEILSHLEMYHYASRDHVIWALLAESGARIGALRSLDLKDFDPENQTLQFRYRPETGTSLKNDIGSERLVGLIRDETVEIVQDHISAQREPVLDEHGREPLLTTANGRIGRSTLRKAIYRWSCPQEIGKDCQHDESMTSSDAWRCQNNACPHMIRRGVITHLLREDVPIDYVSDRCDVSPAVIRTHYDQRSESERMEARSQVIAEKLAN
jgi:integrase